MSHKDLIKVSETCDLCLRIITHRVHNVNPPQKSPRTHTKSSRESSHKHTNLVETSYIHTTISTRPGIILASRRDLCYNHTILTGSRRAMYDDYDLDYTYTNDASYDLEGYPDLDEDYARDAHDYESLAYRHYA